MINQKDILVLSNNCKNPSNLPSEEIESNNVENNNLNYQNTNNKIIDSSTDNSKIENDNELSQPKKNSSIDKSNSCYKNKKFLLIIGLITLSVIIAIVVTLIIMLKKPDNPMNNPDDPIEPINTPEVPDDPINPSEDNIPTPINPIPKNEKKIETELQIKSNVKDLKSIIVEQSYTENVTSNGNMSTINVNRKTIYEYFYLSEEEPDEENINFYDKKYSVAILINSQCFSTNDENCTPNKMIDLKNVKSEDIQNSLRYLDEEIELEDIPIPLCVMNLTDNNVITSIRCPQKLQKNIIQNMKLDTYFFRPPAIKRPDKNKNNVTLNKWKENDTYYMRELNGGMCDIPDAFNSFCSTEMNTTIDLDGNLLTYDEVAITNITNDKKNSFYKIKTTKLKDISKELDNVNKTSYEQILNKIISKLSSNMIEEELFSTEQFKVLYKLSKNITDKKDSNRNLDDKNDKKTLVPESVLLDIQNSGGVKILYKLINDIGLNTESLKAMTNLMIDDSKHEVSNLKEYSSIGEVLNHLIVLSKSGNELLLELYNKMNDCFDNITIAITNNMTNLINIIKYNDLSEIFDSTLSIENLMNLPISILVESANLKNNLQTVYNNIDNGGMKNNIKVLNNDINNYIQNSHILVNNIYKNLQNLSQSLNSSKSKFTEISTYFLNNTPSSFIDTINEASEILMNYYKNEKKIILDKLQEPLNLFESRIKESINKEEKIINSLYSKLENEQINITNGNEDDYRNLKLNLYNTKKYILDIITKGKEKIEKEMDLKDNGYFISNYDLESNNDSYFQTIENAKQISNKLDNDEYIDKVFCETMSKFKQNYTNICKYMDIIKKENFPLFDDALNTSFFNNTVKQSFDFDKLGVSIYI